MLWLFVPSAFETSSGSYKEPEEVLVAQYDQNNPAPCLLCQEGKVRSDL